MALKEKTQLKPQRSTFLLNTELFAHKDVSDGLTELLTIKTHFILFSVHLVYCPTCKITEP